jgi:hypothetical protein
MRRQTASTHCSPLAGTACAHCVVPHPRATVHTAAWQARCCCYCCRVLLDACSLLLCRRAGAGCRPPPHARQGCACCCSAAPAPAPWCCCCRSVCCMRCFVQLLYACINRSGGARKGGKHTTRTVPLPARKRANTATAHHASACRSPPPRTQHTLAHKQSALTMTVLVLRPYSWYTSDCRCHTASWSRARAHAASAAAASAPPPPAKP